MMEQLLGRTNDDAVFEDAPMMKQWWGHTFVEKLYRTQIDDAHNFIIHPYINHNFNFADQFFFKKCMDL